MRVDLRRYGLGQELYVNGVPVLASEEMGAREALEAIGDFSREVEFLAVGLRPDGTPKLFDDRFLVKGSGEPAGGEERTA